jgi:hypothetical protein
MRPRAFLFVVSLGMMFGAEARGQKSWWAGYEARAKATQVDQPQWATPLNTTSPRVEQGVRADFIRQTAVGGATTWNYGGTKGLQFIPFARTEIEFSPPAFFAHSNPKVLDGFGDVSFRMKYRLYGSNEAHHNAIVTFVLQGSYPTGKHMNGSCCSVVTPTLEAGKGFGSLALTSSMGGTLPVSNVRGPGRSIAWNNAVQYRLSKLLWVEDEFNSTFYFGGKNDGKQQTFNTPGVVVSRIPIGHYDVSGAGYPLVLTLGAGEQIALTHFNTYNHAPIFSGRMRF